MNKSSELPLISFCLKSFNQKALFRDAFKAAIAQSYPNLEIIISDDHSTDGSDELIQSMIAAYKASGGTRTIIYNRNERNLGNYCNAEQTFHLAKGELIVQADGDDISCPNRVARIVEEWIKADKKPAAILHGAYEIDGANRVFGVIKTAYRGDWLPHGAAMAWSPKVVSEFPSCSIPCVVDDSIFVIRALYFGSILKIDEPLVYYRVGSGCSSSITDMESATWKCIKFMRSAYLQWDIDLKSMGGKVPPAKIGEMSANINRIKSFWEDVAKSMEPKSVSRLRLLEKFTMCFFELIMSRGMFERVKRFRRYLGYRKGIVKYRHTVEVNTF